MKTAEAHLYIAPKQKGPGQRRGALFYVNHYSGFYRFVKQNLQKNDK
jgi:hypothetical protein